MNKPWPTKKLGEILELCDSGTWGDESPNGMPLLRSTNMQNGQLILDDLKFIDVPKDKISRYILREGDILITKSSGSVDHIGKSLYITKEMDGKYGFSNFTQRLRVNVKFALPKWIYLIISNPETRDFLLKVSQTTTGLRNLKIPALKELKIPLPPLSEQKRIVEIIEKLFAKIEEAERLRAESLAASAALLPSALHQVFNRAKKENWPTKKLGEIAETKMGGTPRTTHKEFWNNGNIIWITPEDMRKNTINFIRDSRRKITILGLEKSSAKLFPKNTVFVSTTATIGKIGIAEREISTNQQITGIICKESIVPKFLAYYFLYLGEKGLKMIGGQLVATHINQTNFRKLEIPIPPLSEQKRIIEYLDALSQKFQELQKLQQQTAADFSALRQSILSEVFNQK